MPKLFGLLALLRGAVLPAHGHDWTRDWTRNWGNSQHEGRDNYFESVQESLQAGLASGARKIKDEWSKLKGQVAEETEYWNEKAKRSWEEGSEYWCGRQGKRDLRKEDTLKQEAKTAEKRALELEKKLQKLRREAKQWETQAESRENRARQAEKQRDQLREELRENERSMKAHERVLQDHKRSHESCRRDGEKMEELQDMLHRCHSRIDLFEERLTEEKTSARDDAVSQASCSCAQQTAAEAPSSLERYIAGAVIFLGAVGWYFLSQQRIGSLTSKVERQSSLLASLHSGHPDGEESQGELQQLREEAEAKDARIAKLERELHEELGVVSAEGANSELGHDFSFGIFDDEEAGEHLTRTLKIHCPGVVHDDVSVKTIFNGCVVTIARQASFGVQATTWSRRFQFRISEGVFEFADERARLEQGFLHLVFRGHTSPVRVFRFPQHFTMEAMDAYSDLWLPSDGAGASSAAAAQSVAPGLASVPSLDASPAHGALEDHVEEQELGEGGIGAGSASVRSSTSVGSWTQVDGEEEEEEQQHQQQLCLQ